VSLNAATIEILLAKGLSGADILEVARASEMKADRTNAERQARFRARKSNAVTVTPVTENDPPNEYISNPRVSPSGAKAPPSPFAEKIVSAWNAGPAARGAKKAIRLDASRRKLLAARQRENTEDEIFAAMANLAANKFHCGENDRGWRVNLGWFLKAENFTKALEMGGGEQAQSTGQFDTPEARAAFLAKLEDKPWSQPPDKPPDRPAAYAASPPRTIGQITRQITQDQAA
jgi:hypothetical protein